MCNLWDRWEGILGQELIFKTARSVKVQEIGMQPEGENKSSVYRIGFCGVFFSFGGGGEDNSSRIQKCTCFVTNKSWQCYEPIKPGLD